jgi:hypothetical protein
MAAAGTQNDLDTLIMSAVNRRHISMRNDKFGIQDGAVDIDGQEPDRRGRHK